MDYFVLEQLDYISINATKTSKTKDAVLYKTSEISKLSKFDYIHKESLISERVKQLFERYSPQNSGFRSQNKNETTCILLQLLKSKLLITAAIFAWHSRCAPYA